MNLAINILVGLLCFVLGAVTGVVARSIHRPKNVTPDIIDAIVDDFRKKETGAIIKRDPVIEFLKDHKGELSIDSILQDE